MPILTPPRRLRSALPAVCAALVLLALASACSGAGTQTTVTVVQRCGDLNFDDLDGFFGRVFEGNQINSKFRLKFEREGAAITAKYVDGGHGRHLLTGERTGNETMTFSGSGRSLNLSISQDCRLEVADAAFPDSPHRYVVYPDVARLDFEPCTERLYLRKAAKSFSSTKSAGPADKVTVVTEDTLPIAAWAAPGEVGAGCEAIIDLWVDGGAEADTLLIETKNEAGKVRWLFDYETQYLGKHGFAMHRFARCDGVKTALGVACTEIEVR